MLPYRFEPEAEEELQDAADWYEAEHDGLGAAFLARAREAAEFVRQFPKAGTPMTLVTAVGVRQHRFRQFPYRMVYVVANEEVVVLAVAHDRRRPGYWNERRPSA